jgi:hypothetical protein
VPVADGVAEFEGVGVAVRVGVCEYIPEPLELTERDLFDDKEALFVCIKDSDTSGLNVAERLGNTVLVYNSEEVDNLLGEFIPDTLTELEIESLTRELILGLMLDDTDGVLEIVG